MAAFDTTRPFAATGSTFGSFGIFFTSIFANLVTWNDTRLTRKTLAALTDRELYDIGLERGDIEEVSRLR